MFCPLQIHSSIITPFNYTPSGSIAFLFEPLASILAGWLTDTFGRKRTMLVVNVPHIVAWFLMYRATSTVEVFIAGALLGLGIGLIETCVLAYVGEIWYERQ